jgi:hypothetical protein
MLIRHRVRLGLPADYQAHFWLSKRGSNSVRFLSDVEKTVADGPESAGMGTAAGFQSKILGFTFLIAPPRGVRQVVNGVPQSWIAGEPAGDGAAFARLAGDRGHTALEKA